MILIPVKNLKEAKQRLSPVLDQSARTELAQAMLHDVVDALAFWPNRPEIAVVSLRFLCLVAGGQIRIRSHRRPQKQR